jgi:hypothetical protein
MTQEMNNYFCLVQHDAPLQLPELDGLAQYFSRFDRQVIETNLSCQELMELLVAKYAVDKDIPDWRLRDIIEAMPYASQTPDIDYSMVLKSKYSDQQALTITLAHVYGRARLFLEHEDGEEVQI